MAENDSGRQISLFAGRTAAEAAEGFLRAVRDADEPAELVKALPPQDLLLVAGEADEEERAELMLVADREQLLGLVDLACWRGDLPDLSALLETYEPLVAAGLDGAIKALDDMEEEMRTLLLKRYVVVHLHEDKNEDIPAAEGSELVACPDGHYYMEIPDPDDLPRTVRQFLEALLSKPFEEYQRELECVRHDLPSDLEETALRWRNGRLADLGFGSREEAMALLSPRDPEAVWKMVEGAGGSPIPPPPRIDIPAIYRRNLGGARLIDEAMAVLEGSGDGGAGERERIAAEMGVLTSLFLTASRCDLSKIEQVERGTVWARDILNLGLDAVSGGDPSRAARALSAVVPSILFQGAMGVLVPLRERARAVLADGRLQVNGLPGLLLDPPFLAALNGLARDVPARWQALDEGLHTTSQNVEPLPGELTAFSSVDDTAGAAMLLEEAERVPGILFGALGWDPSTRQGPSGKVASVIVLTALASAAAGRDPEAIPVSEQEAEQFAEAAIGQDAEAFMSDAVAVLSPAVGCAADGTLDPAKEDDPDRRALLRLVWIGRSRLEEDLPLLAVITG